MQEFKVKVKVISERDVFVCAKDIAQARELGINICSNIEKLKFSNDDIVKVEGTLITDSLFNGVNENCTTCDCFCNRIKQCIDCEKCELHCSECGSCNLDFDENKDFKQCLGCEYYCDICGVCSLKEDEIDDEDDYIDEEFELRKGIFTDYLKETIKEITEYASMIRNGAVSFSDDGYPVENMGVLRKALEYLSVYKKPLFLHCEDRSLSDKGSMNESNISTKIGLPGIHRSPEETAIAQ
ncbi:MAG: hypothetical protein EOM11_10950, partial [Erysipelotrichia bacterium]|nr:hypothetical protein [Erysipelotrichia bacterium]